MKQQFLIGLPFVITFIICGLFFAGFLIVRSLNSNEELASKPEWSIVQVVEFQHRDKRNDTIEFITIDGYALAGIPAKDMKTKVWIMLNAKNPPYYKQIPQGNYNLSKQDFKSILTSNTVSSTVENCLESHVEEP